MKLKILVLSLLALVFTAAPVYAVEVVSPTKDNPNTVVGAQENHKNLYVTGSQVTVNSNTKGDLTAAGGMVNVTGNVEQEVLIAGGNINLSGAIGNTVRIIGGNITIAGPVGGDLVMAGGNISVSGKSEVQGDLMIAGGNVIIDAPVKGNVKIAGGSVTINSVVSGSVEIIASRQLNFGSGAQVAGNITYKGQQAAVVDPSAKISQINFTQIQVKKMKPAMTGLFTLGFLIKLLAWIITAWILVHFKKNFVFRLNDEFKIKPWENLGVGFLALVATPIAVVLLLVTLVGYYAAFLLGLVYVLALAVATLLSSVVLGNFILSKVKKFGEVPADWQVVITGVIVWMLLSYIPVVGWLVMAVWFLMVLGAGVKLLKRSA